METVLDGVRIFHEDVGPASNYPLIVLHGGPGLDHSMFRPWLDPLSDTFRLIYMDERGQGRSQRVDPATLSLRAFADDVDRLAVALGLARFALLGHSFGAMIALTHAVERGTATHYILSAGTASFTKSMPEIRANLEGFEPIALREQVTRSWDLEPEVKTEDEARRLLAMQMPFHFATVESDAYRRFTADDRTVYAPEVLAYFAVNEYAIEYDDRLSEIARPTLIVTGELDRTCTPRAARDMHAGIRESELVLIPGAGHMAYVERPDVYLPAVRQFFARHG